MENILNVLILAAIGLVILLVVGFIGFKIPAPLLRPPGAPTGPVIHLTSPDSLPPAARRWLFYNSQAAPAPSSLAAWGRGWVASSLPVLGRVWLPLSWTIYLIPGSSFIILNRITWFTRFFIRGGEEFRGGKGAFIIGKHANEYPYLDETERALAWFYSIWLASGSLANMPDVNIDPGEDGDVKMTVQAASKPEIQFKLDFDPQTGLLRAITGTRKGGRTGSDLFYQATLSQPRSFEGAGTIPSRYTANWDHDINVKLELGGILLNQDVTDPMRAGLAELHLS